MTSVVLEPHTKGCDGVGLSTLRDFSKVVDAGYQWVSLYLGGTYGVKPYAIEAAWTAGLPVMLNYERVASAAKGGYQVGKEAAQTAMVQADALGFHGEAPLPFSAADEHFADLAGAGLDYHRALVDVLAPHGWVGGAYGFREMLALIAQQEWWPDDWPLWHWGGDGSTIYDWTWVKQGPGGSYYDATIGMSVDRNTLYKPMKFWAGYGVAPPPIIPEELVTLDAKDKEWIEQTIRAEVLDLWRSEEIAGIVALSAPDKEWIATERTKSEQRMAATTQQIVFDVVLGLWREPEIHNYLTMHDAVDLALVANAVVAALPPGSGVVDPAVLHAAIIDVLNKTDFE